MGSLGGRASFAGCRGASWAGALVGWLAPTPSSVSWWLCAGIETGAKFDSGVALYDFEPSQTDELRLRQDETMLILQDFGDGWLR